MEQKSRPRKRPCRVCGKWFMPNPRLGDRQKTCGAEECQRRRHTDKCAQWNRQNRTYFKEIHLKKRLQSQSSSDAQNAPPSSPPARANRPQKGPPPLHLPLRIIQEEIGVQQSVIIEYIVRVLQRAVQEAIGPQHSDIVDELAQVVVTSSSRFDSHVLL